MPRRRARGGTAAPAGLGAPGVRADFDDDGAADLAAGVPAEAVATALAAM